MEFSAQQKKTVMDAEWFNEENCDVYKIYQKKKNYEDKIFFYK